jgi:hypothetical protein
MSGLAPHVSWSSAQFRQTRASAAPSEPAYGPKAEDRKPGWLLIRHSPADNYRFRPKFATVWRSRRARAVAARRRRAPRRLAGPFLATPSVPPRGLPSPTSHVPR